MSVQRYIHHPLVFEDRRRDRASSEWVRSFDCRALRPLIICRGPVRLEAMDIFAQMGIEHYGILLSEKDSIAFAKALAPELRRHTEQSRIHRVADYTGVDQSEREERIAQIIAIARGGNYNAVFAGYGFMAEDEALVSAIEDAGLMFVGPCSRTVREAGRKDVAKRTALEAGISVTPGVDNVTTLALLRRYPDREALLALAKASSLTIDDPEATDESELANQLLEASYDARRELVTVDMLCEEIRRQVSALFEQFPDRRLRLKAIGGGGGKGQRLLAAPSSFDAPDKARQIELAAAEAPARAREILAEVKATGPGDNKNLLIELNIDSNRHQEVQLLGNGEWCVALGARDCSLQMHEQKLLEVSVTDESLSRAISAADKAGNEAHRQALNIELETLRRMEEEAERFGLATGLDSVSTFECIVDGDRHYFMEMNTRIQVEHRVTELCYALEFVNPDNDSDRFAVNSLIEAMAILALHGKRLPRPLRRPRNGDAVEARLNATNDALAPHAGGLIASWSPCLAEEIRDDQGISVANPDTGLFMPYYLAGAYDSNIALLLSVGDSRRAALQSMAEILRRTKIRGRDLETNLDFHYGMTCWLLAQHVRAKVGTRFVSPYLAAVGELFQAASQIDLELGYRHLEQRLLGVLATAEEQASLSAVMQRKKTLLLRPLSIVLSRPHLLSGWLSTAGRMLECGADGARWKVNPIEVLDALYDYLSMDYQPDQPPAYVIWDHDNELLGQGKAFYQRLDGLQADSFSQLDTWLGSQDPPGSAPKDLADRWPAIAATHKGFQAGMEILALPHCMARETAFFGLSVNDDLTVEIPASLEDSGHQAAMRRILAPPPRADGNEVVAESGGMFYSREAPDRPAFVTPGDRFEEGDPLYVIEVMKMFNVVRATYSGVVEEVLVAGDGMVVKKGQPLFRVTPDEPREAESAEEGHGRRVKATCAAVDSLLPEAIRACSGAG